MGVTQFLINMFFTGALVRFLGKHEYGLYVLLGSVAAYVSIFDFGLNNTVSRYVAKYAMEGDKKKESNMLFITFSFYIIIMILIFLVGFILLNHLNILIAGIQPPHEQLAKTLFLLLVLNLAITLPLNTFSAVLVGYEQFIYTRVVSILRVIAVPVLSLPLLYFGSNSVSVVIVTTGVNIAAGLCNAVYAYKKYHIKLCLYYFDKALVKELFLFSSAIFVGVVADQLFFNTGNIVLGAMRGTLDVSVFGTSSQLIQYIVAIAAAFCGVYLPRATNIAASRNSQQISTFFCSTSRLISVMLIFVLGGYCLLGRELVFFWLGKQLNDVFYVSLVIMIPTVWTLTRTLGLSLMQAMNMHAYRSKILAVRAVVNGILCVLVAKRYSFYGISACYALCIICSNIIMDFYYQRRMGIAVWRFTKSLWPVALSACIACCMSAITYAYFPYSLLAMIVRGLIYACLFGVGLYCLYLNVHEKEKLNSYLKYRMFRRADRKVTAQEVKE